METKTPELNAYWIFDVASSARSGVWTVEVRIDGEPSGSLPFELSMPEPKAEPPPALAPSLDQLYASVGRSVVWIYQVDDAGRHTDRSLGFVIAKDTVATAFQAIDASLRFEAAFSDGRKVVSDEVWACSRAQDWALLKVDTGTIPALARTQSASIPVGERYIVFNVEGAARVIGGVDITGKRNAGVFGDRIQIAPQPAREAIGGPLLNPQGLVAGIVGGSTIPGARFSQFATSVSRALWSRSNEDAAAIPISSVPATTGNEPLKLQALLDRGILTPPLVPSLSLVYGQSARNVPKGLEANNASEFSHADKEAWIYTMWQKKDKETKGIVSAKVYDYRNQLRLNVEPKKVSLIGSAPVRASFAFPLENFTTGTYRVDVLWNGQPAWRTFFIVTD